MTIKSSQSETFATHIQGANLDELQNILRDLRQMRSIRKQAGKKSFDQTGIRVELPVGADTSSADILLKQLSVDQKSDIIYSENPKLIAGIRVFI